MFLGNWQQVYQNLNYLAIKKCNCYWTPTKLSDKLTTVTVLSSALKHILYLRQCAILDTMIGSHCPDTDVFWKPREMEVERGWHGMSEEDAANTATLQTAQGLPKHCEFNIRIDITRKWGSSPPESLKVPKCQAFLAAKNQFSKMLGQMCHMWPPHPPPCVPLSPRAPSRSLRSEPIWLSLSRTAWLCSGWCCPVSSLSSLLQVCPSHFCTKHSVCPAGSSLLGQDYQDTSGENAPRLICPSACL